MKKLIAAAVASVVLVASVAAPSFAAQSDKCVFKEASLCAYSTESLSPTTGDDD